MVRCHTFWRCGSDRAFDMSDLEKDAPEGAARKEKLYISTENPRTGAREIAEIDAVVSSTWGVFEDADPTAFPARRIVLGQAGFAHGRWESTVVVGFPQADTPARPSPVFTPPSLAAGHFPIPPRALANDEQVFEAMIGHIQAVNQSVLQTIEKIEKTINVLTTGRE